MPLWTNANWLFGWVIVSRWGWELVSLTIPVVAQRVWNNRLVCPRCFWKLSSNNWYPSSVGVLANLVKTICLVFLSIEQQPSTGYSPLWILSKPQRRVTGFDPKRTVCSWAWWSWWANDHSSVWRIWAIGDSGLPGAKRDCGRGARWREFFWAASLERAHYTFWQEATVSWMPHLRLL